MAASGRRFANRAVILLSMAWSAAPIPADSIAPPDRQKVFAQGLMELELAEARIRRHPDSLAPHMDRLRVLFVLGVKDAEYLKRGRGQIEFLAASAEMGGADRNILLGYAGAMKVAEAKHGLNLNRKWKNLQAGIPMLDTAVARDPSQTELRYLRLVSNYYLPFFLGRKPVVQEDFSALARLLPDAAGRYPAKWFLNVAGFVLEKGSLDEERREGLQRKMRQVSASIRNPGSRPGRNDENH